MVVDRPLIVAVLAGWIPVVVLLFRVLGPRRATLIAVIGGYAFLPRVMLETPLPVQIQLNKLSIIGVGLALGLLCVDWRTLARARPHWLDLPMVVFAVYPLMGLAIRGRAAPWDVADSIVQHGVGWLVPYVAARLYFGDSDGARRISVAVVAATLLLVPVCVFEAVMGPRWYLAGLIYGLPYQAGMVNRLGGWRPEGFFNNGLDLANWMALGAVMSFWLWIGRSWRPRWGPAWWPALVLVLTSALCRGLYGYVTLGFGLAAALLTWSLRTRWVLVALALLAPSYITLRVSGLWDARSLADLSGFTGRSGSVAVRLWTEDEVMAPVLANHPAFGFGYHIRHSRLVWPDGHWLVLLWEGGLVGLTIHLAAVHLVPAGLALARPPGRPSRRDAVRPLWGLALFTILHMNDSVHTQFYLPPTALIAGALVGSAVGRPSTRRTGPEPHGTRTAHETYRPVSNPAAIPVVAGLACLLYVFGHGPVPGHETVKLLGGLGAALLFAAAGGVGAWASEQVRLSRLALFCLLFAALGVSFNLALHPSTRPCATADILQGLALSGLVVACWRRWFGAGAEGDAILAALPLVAHFLLRPHLGTFPGLQYLIAAPTDVHSLFPLCPWLTMAALGAWASRMKIAGNLAAAALFTLMTAFVWWAIPDREGPIKFPMNLSYAMLSCAAVGAAFSLAQGLKGQGPAARWIRWLGRCWLVFFYLHFAVVFALQRSAGLPSWAIWGLLAIASIAGTWLTWKALAPFGRWFQAQISWGVLLALIFITGLVPGIPPAFVAGVAGLAGLVFAVHYESLAFGIMNARWVVPFSSAFPDAPRFAMSSSSREQGSRPAANSLGRNLIRLAVVLTLLATPEILDAAARALQKNEAARKARPATPSPHPNSPRPIPGNDRASRVPRVD